MNDRADHALVLYDGDCPLCRRSVALLRRLDWFGVLEYVSFRDAYDPLLAQIPVQPERLQEEMHLLVPGVGTAYHGFAAFRWMAWRLPPLWPLAPLLSIPGVPRLGQRIYLWIARNRFRLVPCHGGICTIHKDRNTEQSGRTRQ